MSATIDTTQATQALALLHEPGQVFEIRILNAPKSNGYKVTIAGYFDDYAAAAKAIIPYNGKANIYTTLNPCKPALLARAANRLIEISKTDLLTGDKDIETRRWLGLDIDPIRPAGISSTETELTTALALAGEVRSYLAEWGWPAPVEAHSGNGGHLVYPLALPNDEASAGLIKNVLEHLAGRFNSEAAKVDVTVFNAARIWKVYGTMAVKGDNLPTRPHRLASIQMIPSTLEIVTPEMLKAIAPASVATVAPGPVYRNGTGYTEAEIESTLNSLGIDYTKKLKYGRTIYPLGRCLTSDAHTDGACITLENGMAGYKCHHDSCSAKTWQDVKPVLFPAHPASQPAHPATEDEAESEPLPDIEPLPADIPYFDRPHTDHFTGLFVDYALKVSPMTPADFHESAGLWLASVAIARRLKVPMPFGDVYPNLFILWMAHTTLYRKTTALDVARRIARRIMPHLLMPQDSTPEAMLADLAGREPVNLDNFSDANKEIWKRGRNFAAQRGWSLDELSSLLAGAGKDYNQGLTEGLLRLYDCDEKFSRSTRSGGLTIVENSYLALLGASTPGAMATHINNTRLWSMGFWPRFAILTPEERPEWQEPQEATEPAQLGAALHNLLNRLPASVWPDPPQALTVTLADGVYQTWQRYNKAVSYDLLTDELDERLHGAYGRLPTQVIKVATILAALDWTDEPAPVIQSYHLAHAIAICEKWRASAHRAIEMANEDETSKFEKRVIKQLGRYGTQGATLRTLHQGMKDKSAGDVEGVLLQLVKLGMVAEEETEPGPKGGRKTTIYKLI